MDSAEIERRLFDLERRFSRLEASSNEKSVSSPGGHPDLQTAIIDKVDEIGQQDLVIVSLRLNGKQTKEQVRKTFETWGKAYGNWFRGGNFSKRLVKKGVVRVDEKDKEGNDIYALTMKGVKLADELLTGLRSGTE